MDGYHGGTRSLSALPPAADIVPFNGVGRLNEIRANPADISQAVAPLGANGFNIPSLRNPGHQRRRAASFCHGCGTARRLDCVSAIDRPDDAGVPVSSRTTSYGAGWFATSPPGSTNRDHLLDGLYPCQRAAVERHIKDIIPLGIGRHSHGVCAEGASGETGRCPVHRGTPGS